MADTRNLTNSNTTNVKVKLYLNGSKSEGLKHSNTTNVKVKRTFVLFAKQSGYIQIQPMLRLNITTETFTKNSNTHSNTTNVKVKPVSAVIGWKNFLNSNTTNVKVKLPDNFVSKVKGLNSNTTNVKVKLHVTLHSIIC